MPTTVPDTTSGSAATYRSAAGAFDEAFDADGDPRPHYEAVIDALEGADLSALSRAVAHDVALRGASFRGTGATEAFRVDPVPRLIEAAEWAHVERGLRQRVRALNSFLADLHGERRIVDAGLVPERLVETALHHQPWMRDVPVPRGVYANAVGVDLVRDENGRLRVLEDNVRTPSGYAYLLAARDVLEERLPAAVRRIERESIGDIVERLGDALRAAAPEGVDEPAVGLLSGGPRNSAWWEHRAIARRLGLPIVALDQIDVRGGRVHARVDGELRRFDVLYRRTDEDTLQHRDGRPTALAEALVDPLRRGTLTVVNSFGAGIADDKLTHAYVPAIIRYYLGEEPVLASVDTYDLGDPDARAEALADFDAMVVKERCGEGARGVTIVARASRDERDALRAELRRRPQDFVAQRRIALSTHPTVIDGRLEPRHVDLRPFCLQSGDDVHVVAGGLTRVAFGEGELVVNSSQDGGGKDTWVLR